MITCELEVSSIKNNIYLSGGITTRFLEYNHEIKHQASPSLAVKLTEQTK